MLINVTQINPNQLALFVQQAASGASFSGNMLAYFNANGFIGNNVVYVTGANQTISGIKTFLSSPGVPYIGGTGAAPSRRYVDDQDLAISGVLTGQMAVYGLSIGYLSGFTMGMSGAVSVAAQAALVGASGVLNTNIVTVSGLIGTLSGFTTTMSGALSAIRVTGSVTQSIVDITGLGGTIVFQSGNRLFISGGAGGGGGGSSNTSVTGSAAISAPNFTGVGTVTLTYDGTYVRVSGATASATPDVALSGYLEGNFVHRGLITESVSGLKTFTGALGVGNPTATGHAINLGYLGNVSGVLYGQMTGISGALVGAGGSTINNTFNVTGTGTINNAFNSSGGSITNTFNDFTSNLTTYVLTGVVVNASFFLDQYNTVTGLNLIEAFIGNGFNITGYALGLVNTGTISQSLSGSLYQKSLSNVKSTIFNFTLTSGVYSYVSGGLSLPVTGLNRLGLDLTNVPTGMTGLSVGVFGIST